MTILVKCRTNQMSDIRIYKLTQNIIFDIKSIRIKSAREGDKKRFVKFVEIGPRNHLYAIISNNKKT